MSDPVLLPPVDIPPPAPGDRVVFEIHQSQLDAVRDAAGKAWPSIIRYWPSIIAVILATGVFSAGVAHVATKESADPAPIPLTIDFKPVVDAVNALGADLKKGNTDVRADIAAMSKKFDDTPAVPVPNPNDPPLTDPGVIPASTDAKIGRQTSITAKATGDVYWIIAPASPCDTDINGSKITIVPHAEATAFPIGVFTQNKGKWSISWTMVKVGIAPKPPPVPVPNPFIDTLQAAYVADGKPAAALSKLLITYTLAPAIINNPANKYPIDIVKVNSAAITAQIEPGAPKTVLVNVRTAIDTELRKTLPLNEASAVELTPAVRQLFLTQYANIATALKGVQP